MDEVVRDRHFWRVFPFELNSPTTTGSVLFLIPTLVVIVVVALVIRAGSLGSPRVTSVSLLLRFDRGRVSGGGGGS